MSNKLDHEEFAAFVKQQKEWRNFYNQKKSYDIFEWAFDIFKGVMTIPLTVVGIMVGMIVLHMIVYVINVIIS